MSKPVAALGSMVATLESKLPSISDACRVYGVERLDLFGSAARASGAAAFRDFDFVVRFANPEVPGYADRYLGLAETLEKTLGRPVDLITERSLRNPIFVQMVERDRRTIYAAA